MNLTKTSNIENELGRLIDSAVVNNYSIYLFVLGNQTKSSVDTLQDKIPGIMNLWTGWSGPKWMKLIFFFTAGYAGLYKDNDCKQFKELSLEASLGGLVQIIISKTNIDEKLVRVISDNGVNPHNIRNMISETDNNLLIEIACDRPEQIDGNDAGYFNLMGDKTLVN